jgi:hypothetical protein
MKTSIVPAQVTSLEDVIAANLTLTQLVLLTLPIFISAIIFVFLPPLMHIKIYKIVLLIMISAPLLILAIRVRGQVLIKSAIALINYSTRPRIYLSSVSQKCRCTEEVGYTSSKQEIQPEDRVTFKPEPIEPIKIRALENALRSKQLQFITNSDGQLNVVIRDK